VHPVLLSSARATGAGREVAGAGGQKLARADGAGRQRGYCALFCAVVSETLVVQRPCRIVARRRCLSSRSRPGTQQQFAGAGLGLWEAGTVGISTLFSWVVHVRC